MYFSSKPPFPLIKSFSRPKIKFINPSQETPSFFLQTPSLVYVHGTVHSALSIPRSARVLIRIPHISSLRHWCPLFSTRGNPTRKNFRRKVLYEQVQSTLALSNDIPLSILGGCHYCMYNHTLGNHFPIIQHRGICVGHFPLTRTSSSSKVYSFSWLSRATRRAYYSLQSVSMYTFSVYAMHLTIESLTTFSLSTLLV